MAAYPDECFHPEGIDKPPVTWHEREGQRRLFATVYFMDRGMYKLDLDGLCDMMLFQVF